METIIDTFHVDLWLLTAQAVNFGVVFLVLYFIAVKPLTRMMRDRTARIEKGLDDARKIEARLTATGEEQKKMIKSAKQEAHDIIKEAHAQAEANKEDMIAKAREEIGSIIAKEKAVMRNEKARTIAEIKEDVTDIVVAAIERVLEKKFDGEEDKKLIRRVVKRGR